MSQRFTPLALWPSSLSHRLSAALRQPHSSGPRPCLSRCSRPLLQNGSKPRYTPSSRGYATISASEPATPDDSPISWPTIQHPTPYEIFHIASGAKIDKKAIKKTFHYYAKIYHPDAASASESTSPVSSELKEERFKKIVSAYDILKDDVKRRDFDLFNKGWEDSPRAASKNFYGRDFTRSTRYKTDVSSEDDSWAAFHSEYRDHMRQQDPEYHKSQWKAHKRMVAYIFLGSLVVGAIQFSFLMKHANASSEVRSELSQKTFNEVSLALANYGFGFSKEDRINRFLAHRESSHMYDNTWEHSDEVCAGGASLSIAAANERYTRSIELSKLAAADPQPAIAAAADTTVSAPTPIPKTAH